jgi:hypothetical protein
MSALGAELLNTTIGGEIMKCNCIYPSACNLCGDEQKVFGEVVEKLDAGYNGCFDYLTVMSLVALIRKLTIVRYAPEVLADEKVMTKGHAEPNGSCYRCGEPATQVFNICCMGDADYPLCVECDIMLNEFVVNFMKVPDRDVLIRKYTKLARGGTGKESD